MRLTCCLCVSLPSRRARLEGSKGNAGQPQVICGYWKPTPEDKVKLAKLGLGLKTLSFRSEGDADHVHDVIVGAFPVLKDCGGYTLLRLDSGSRRLMEIEGPESGVTDSYLKDILSQAKLYIRPLQCDITVEDMQPYLEHSVSEYKAF